MYDMCYWRKYIPRYNLERCRRISQYSTAYCIQDQHAKFTFTSTSAFQVSPCNASADIGLLFLTSPPPNPLPPIGCSCWQIRSHALAGPDGLHKGRKTRVQSQPFAAHRTQVCTTFPLMAQLVRAARLRFDDAGAGAAMVGRRGAAGERSRPSPQLPHKKQRGSAH